MADLFEIVEGTILTEAESRRVIDLLSESVATPESRMSAADWEDEVSALVSELLSAVD